MHGGCTVKLDEVDFMLPKAELVSRNAKFNMLWFEKNVSSAGRLLEFGTIVAETMDPCKYRMTVLDCGNRYEFRFWGIKNGKINRNHFMTGEFYSIFVTKKGYVLNIKKRNCIQNHFLYAVAIKLELFKVPRKWETIMNMVKGANTYRGVWRYNIEDGSQIYEFRDKYYHVTKIPVHFAENHLMHFMKMKKRFQNMKQFKGLDTDKKRKAFTKFLRKMGADRYQATERDSEER